jgi:hypothetical protein
MRASEARPRMVTAIQFGFDLEVLYLRMDLSRPAAAALAEGLELAVSFLTPAGRRLELRREAGRPIRATLSERGPDGRWAPRGPEPRTWAGTIVEVALSLTTLAVRPGDSLSFVVAATDRGQEVERYPAYNPIETQVPTEDFEALNWTA